MTDPARPAADATRLDPERAARARAFIEALPHVQALGARLVHFGDSTAEIELDWREELVGDPRKGTIHGGVVSTLMDTCCGTAVMAHPTAASSTATIDLRIDYMRAATPRQTLRVRAECFHVTRSVAFVRAVTRDDDDSPVATATGTFTMER